MIRLEQMTMTVRAACSGHFRRELGVYGLARFLRVYRAGTGDYTRDRHQWLQGISVEDLTREFEDRQV